MSVGGFERGGFERLFGLALLAFPRHLRARFGEEMRFAFRAMLRDPVHRASAVPGNRQARPRLALRALLDVVSCGLHARWQAMHERSRGVFRGATPPAPPLGSRSTPKRSTTPMREKLASEIRYALRSLRNAPAFSVAAVAVLALGIGLNSAMFSAVRAAILAPPPYPSPQELVLLDMEFTFPNQPEPALAGWSYPKHQVLLQQPDLVVDPVAGFTRRPLTLARNGDRDALRVDAEVVSSSYFAMLGAQPVAGRFFAREEPTDGVPPPQLVAVLGHDFWQRHFGGDPNVVGQDVQLNGQPVAVVGVMGPDFQGLSGPADLWLPLSSLPVLTEPRQLEMAHAHWFDLVGRLHPEATLAQLNAQLDTIGAVIDRAHPDEYFDEPIGVGARSLAVARRSPNAERSLWVLLAATGLIVLIACGNLAALFESRADGHKRSISIRGALGASRATIVRHVMFEAGLLAVAGAAAGVVIARWGMAGLMAAWPETFREGNGYLELTHLDGLELGLSGLVFAFVLAAVISVLFGLGPALRLSRLVRVPQRALRLVSGTAGRRGIWSSRAALVCGQTALAVTLAIGSGLMISSLARLARVEVGAETSGLLAFRYELGRDHPSNDQPHVVHADLLERFRSIPGVRGAAIGSAPLADHDNTTLVKSTNGEPPVIDNSRPSIGVHYVSDDYFRVLGTPLLAGRSFQPGDHADAPPVVVLNRRAAQELFGTADAVGRLMALSMGLTRGNRSAEVVGVVDDVLYAHPVEGIMLEAYVSARQAGPRWATVLIKTDGEPLTLVPDIRSVMRQAQPGLPIYGVRTVEQIGNEAIGDTRVLTSLLLAFSLLALTLAAVGTYGVTAYWVAGRRRELGVRIALGARNGQVQSMVIGSGLRAVAVGIALGTFVAWVSTRLLTSLLFEVDQHDPLAFAAGAAVLLAVSILASYLPARQAARLDPVAVLGAD